MAEETYAPLYLRGIEQFNQRDFFGSHETWEQLWIGEEGAARLFYKGLIQAAVALCHLDNGNDAGAEKLLAGCGGYLSPYRPKYLGLDLDRLLGDMSRCVAGVLASGAGRVRGPIDPALAPRIRLDPAPHSAADVRYP